MSKKKKRAEMLQGTRFGKIYIVELEPAAEGDLDALAPQIRNEAIKRLKKFETLPKAIRLHSNLEGWYSDHFNNDKYRIILRFDEPTKKIIVKVIGKRDKDYVYKEVIKRIQDEKSD